MVFLMMRATVFLLLIIDLDAAAANTVTSAKVLERFAFIFIRSRELPRGSPLKYYLRSPLAIQRFKIILSLMQQRDARAKHAFSRKCSSVGVL